MQAEFGACVCVRYDMVYTRPGTELGDTGEFNRHFVFGEGRFVLRVVDRGCDFDVTWQHQAWKLSSLCSSWNTS